MDVLLNGHGECIHVSQDVTKGRKKKKLKCNTVSSKEGGPCARYGQKRSLKRETRSVFLIPDMNVVLYQ